MPASFLPLMDNSRLDAELTEVSTTIPIRFFFTSDKLHSFDKRASTCHIFLSVMTSGFCGRNGNWDLVEDT